jgi:hypothetical protein
VFHFVALVLGIALFCVTTGWVCLSVCSWARTDDASYELGRREQKLLNRVPRRIQNRWRPSTSNRLSNRPDSAWSVATRRFQIIAMAAHYAGSGVSDVLLGLWFSIQVLSVSLGLLWATDYGREIELADTKWATIYIIMFLGLLPLGITLWLDEYRWSRRAPFRWRVLQLGWGVRHSLAKQNRIAYTSDEIRTNTAWLERYLVTQARRYWTNRTDDRNPIVDDIAFVLELLDDLRDPRAARSAEDVATWLDAVADRLILERSPRKRGLPFRNGTPVRSLPDHWRMPRAPATGKNLTIGVSTVLASAFVGWWAIVIAGSPASGAANLIAIAGLVVGLAGPAVSWTIHARRG